MKDKKIIISFVIGGTIIALVKWSATSLKNPMLAAIIGGVPIGLMSIYFLTDDETSKEYSKNYFVTTSILMVSIALFYLAMSRSKLNKNIVASLALVFWLAINLGRYFATKKK